MSCSEAERAPRAGRCLTENLGVPALGMFPEVNDLFLCVCVGAYIVVVALGNKNRKRSAACWMPHFLAEGAVVALRDISMGMSWHQPCQGSGSGTTDWGNWVKGQGSSNCT